MTDPSTRRPIRSSPRVFLRTTAALLAAVLSVPIAPGAYAATTTRRATLSGRIVSADKKSPAVGAMVKAVNIVTQRVFTSTATDDLGRFLLPELPAGYYDIGIEHSGALFVAGSVVNLAEGGKVKLDFLLQPYGDKPAEWWQGQKREIPILGQEQGVAKVFEKTRATGGGKSFWKKPGGIAIMVLGGAGAVALAAGGGGGGGGGDNASPSKP